MKVTRVDIEGLFPPAFHRDLIKLILMWWEPQYIWKLSSDLSCCLNNDIFNKSVNQLILETLFDFYDPLIHVQELDIKTGDIYKLPITMIQYSLQPLKTIDAIYSRSFITAGQRHKRQNQEMFLKTVYRLSITFYFDCKSFNTPYTLTIHTNGRDKKEVPVFMNAIIQYKPQALEPHVLKIGHQGSMFTVGQLYYRDICQGDWWLDTK